MIKISGRFAALLLATAPLALTLAVPANAAASAPKLSKAVMPVLQAAQKAAQANDFATALAKAKEAEALPNLTPDDIYTINQFKLNAGLGLKDTAVQEDALTGMLATGKVSAEDQPKFTRFVAQLAYQRKDYAKSTAYFEKLLALAPNDTDTLTTLGELYFAQKQSAKAVDTLNKAIAAAKAAGQPAPEAWYKRSLAIAYDGKLDQQVQLTSQALVAAYPSPVNWRDALVITRDAQKVDDQTLLDFARLQIAAGALNGERDYVEYASTALDRGLPGEAKTVLEKGAEAKMINPAKPVVAEVQRGVNAKLAADKASLPALDKESKGNPKIALGTGDAYYGYGDYAKAASLYRMAVGAPGVDQATANLRLGAALARSGDKTGAMTAFQAVKGGPREALAKYWMIWLNQKA